MLNQGEGSRGVAGWGALRGRGRRHPAVGPHGWWEGPGRGQRAAEGRAGTRAGRGAGEDWQGPWATATGVAPRDRWTLDAGRALPSCLEQWFSAGGDAAPGRHWAVYGDTTGGGLGCC